MLDKMQLVFSEIVRNSVALVSALLLLEHTLCTSGLEGLIDDTIALIAHERLGCAMLHRISYALESHLRNLTPSRQLLLQRAQVLRCMDRFDFLNLLLTHALLLAL